MAVCKSLGYMNWCKGGFCLRNLRQGLLPFVEKEMLTFHKLLKTQLRHTHNQHVCTTTPKGFNSDCSTCDMWKNLIIRNHQNPRTIQWNNSRLPLLTENPWEVAKMFMPRGQKFKFEASEIDVAAILNLLANCKHFGKFMDRKNILEVIKVRNELMHSSDMEISQEQLSLFANKMLIFLHDLKDLPSVQKASEIIKKIQSGTLHLFMDRTSMDHVDGADTLLNIDMEQQDPDLEQLLLKERTMELFATMEEEGYKLTQQDSSALQLLLDIINSQEKLQTGLADEQAQLRILKTRFLDKGQDESADAVKTEPTYSSCR
uniref:uncharacterized protein CXorf38 homolog n=1 Tax=Myxine glutinosa TaxID=7769 RepID=UPI00358FFB5F